MRSAKGCSTAGGGSSRLPWPLELSVRKSGFGKIGQAEEVKGSSGV